MEKVKILHMADGKQYEVVSETPRFYVCKKTQFRKKNPNILKITWKEKKAKEE